jgi:hypothetical protein
MNEGFTRLVSSQKSLALEAGAMVSFIHEPEDNLCPYPPQPTYHRVFWRISGCSVTKIPPKHTL